MKIEIGGDAVEQTTRCWKQFACLSGAVEALCEVKYVVIDELYCLKRTTRRGCNYQMVFGDCLICTCPARQEISRRYGV
jgi:hypothetical protein